MTDIESALKRLQKEADKGRHQFHATRILFGPSPTAEEARSGTDPATGWEPFLGPVEVFESHEYDRGRRWQQGCYFGDDGLLAEYTAVASELAVLLPDARAVPAADRWEPQSARDAWTFATYAVGVDEWGTFQIDTEGDEPFAGSVVDGLAAMIAGSRATVEHDLSLLGRYQTGFQNMRGKQPQLLFARLRVGLITATHRLIEIMHDGWDEFYPSGTDRVRGMQFKVIVPAPSDERSVGRRVCGQNEERDCWLYELCCRGVPYAEIRHRLGDRITAAKAKGEAVWEPLDNDQGVHQAARRHAERHQLALPPARKKGKRTPKKVLNPVD
jgi:hypothetical protein